MQERKTYRGMKKNKIYTIFFKKNSYICKPYTSFHFLNVILLFFWGG